MGCGISKLDDPKEAAGADLPHHSTPSRSSICFTGDQSDHHHHPSSRAKPPPPDHAGKINPNNDHNVGAVKTKKEEHSRNNSSKFHDHYGSHAEDDDDDDRGICRGGSPSFREYCLDSDSISTSIRSTEDNCERWQNERTLDPEKGSEKKERRGKGLMKALHRGRSGGVRNFLNASRRNQSNFHSPHNNNDNDNDDSSHNQKLLAKAS